MCALKRTKADPRTLCMARKKTDAPAAEASAPVAAPAPAPAPAVAVITPAGAATAPPAPPAPPAPAAEAKDHNSSTSDGATHRNRTQLKLLKELDSIRHALSTTFTELDKTKSELKEQKSAVRRPRSVRVPKKRPASEVEVTA